MLQGSYFSVQNVKAYLRRGTARESLVLYKDALQGGSPSISVLYSLSIACK